MRNQIGGAFLMKTRITYSYDTKIKVIEMKLEGYSAHQIQKELGIKNDTQIETWWRWYRNGEFYRLHQPVGKQYSYGKGPEGSSPEETLRLQNISLKQQVKLLKKYEQLEKGWYQQLLSN